MTIRSLEFCASGFGIEIYVFLDSLKVSLEIHISTLLSSIALIAFGKCMNYEASNCSVFFILPLKFERSQYAIGKQAGECCTYGGIEMHGLLVE